MAGFDDLTPYSQPVGTQAVADPAADATAPAQSKKTRNVKKFLQLARDRFKLGQEAEKTQRERELDDLRFYAGDQWPKDVRDQRDGQQANNALPAVPARPCITINKTREPIRQVLNQERGADIGIELVPADDFGELGQPIDQNEIDVREGLVRRIQRESEAHDARTWAFARACQAGRGFYAVLTRYLPGKTRDQEIYLQRIFNQSSVTLDPAHEQPDASDCEWEFIWTWMSWDRYKAEHPRAASGGPNKVSSASDEEFVAFGEEYPEWFKADGETRSVRVGDYWFVEHESRTLAMLPDGRDVWQDELTDDERQQDYETRTVDQKKVFWTKIDATQILDETEWPVEFLPIIKVLGEELQPYDKERRVEGMVRPMRESAQGFNYMVSSLVERIGLAPLPPLMVAEGQVEGYESWYQAANTRTLPFLPYRSRDLEGNQANPPFRTDTGLGAIIGPLSESVQMFNDAIQSVSSIHDPSLGKYDGSARSGRAIMALQQQGAQGTSNYIDNLARSIRYEGKIINALLYPIYGRPGRIARIVSPHGDTQTIMLGKPFTQGTNGQPQPAQPGAPGSTQYTLTPDAQFNVSVKVTKTFDRRREQEQQTVAEMLQATPQLIGVLGDLFFKNMDGPGHNEMAERVKATLDPRVLAVINAQQQGQPSPQMMQQMQQQMQQMQGALQQAQQQIQADTAKYQAQMQIEQMKAKATYDREIQLKQMDIASKIEIARITAARQAADTQLEAQEEAIALNHEATQGHLDRQHEAALAQQEHQHSMEQADQEHQQALQQGDQAHQQALQQGVQQAALQPPPAEPAGG